MRYFRPIFDGNQRRELTRLGLLREQIDSVQEILQPALAMLLNEAKKPAVQDVIAEFDGLSKALNAAHKALADLARADDDEPVHAARCETRLRIELVAYAATREGEADGSMNDRPMMEALRCIAFFEALIARARPDAALKPARRMLASPFPIKLIHEALLHGWVKAHLPNLRRSDDAPRKPLPLFNVRVSASPAGPFRLIVQECYSAMRRPNIDPDRAIKAYMRWLKQERNARRVSDVPS